MKRILMLPTVGIFLLAAGAAMAQTLYTGKVGGDDPKYTDNGKVNGTGGDYVRVDKDATTAHVSYLTVEKKLPYYVAPSLLTHPNWDPQKLEQAGGSLTAFASTWTFTADPTANATVGAPTGNKVEITGAKVGPSEITVREVPAPAGPYGGCGTIEESKFQVMVTGKPKLVIKSAKLGTMDAIVAPYTYKNTTETSLDAAVEVLLIQTCKKIDAATLMLTYEVTEENAPDALKKYAFKVTEIKGKFDASNTYTHSATTDKKDNSLTAKYAVTATPESFTAITLDVPSAGDKVNELVYALKSTANVQGDGVVSAISHRSDNGAAQATGYPFGTPKERYVVIRVTQAPKTGPIYHIPNNANL